MSDDANQKIRQKKYSDSVYVHYHKKGWRRQYSDTLISNFIDYYPLKKAISFLPFSLKGKSVLSICCGDGFEAEYLYRQGAVVTVTDISPEAVKASKRRCPGLKGRAADTENLPFKSKSFDLVLVRDGLHHLPHPYKGLREMDRVSKEGFIILEAQRNFVTKILIKFGLAEEQEISGNYVYRFTRDEIRNVMKEMKIRNFKLTTFWCHYFDLLSKKVYPKLNNQLFFILFKFCFFAVNFLFGYFGNSLVVVAFKKDQYV